MKSYPLSHDGVLSTMFLVENNGYFLAYYGDTGPDSIEKSKNLEETFKVLGPLVQNGKLKAILIESSYDNSRSDNSLFGHLTPFWLVKELEVLGKYSGGMKSLEGFNVIVTHIKPSLKKNGNIRGTIQLELNSNNLYKIKYSFPKQGDKITLK